MIQFTKEFSKQLKREQERQDRIEKCLSYLRVNTEPAMTPSGYITYAAVNSTTTTGRRYIVHIDESGKTPVATRCNCNATVECCIHMLAVTVYYERIVAIFAKEEVAEPVVEETVSLEVAMQEAQDEMVEIIEEAAVAGDRSYAQVVTNAYEMAGEHMHVHCGGCHQICGKGKGDRCKPGFCFWNSFWTEAQRNAA